MKNESLYDKIISLKNLTLAWKKARKGKTRKDDVIEFEENIVYNLKVLHDELKRGNYQPKPLKTFILRDPKTRKISKSAFRDRIVHHALVRIIEPIFDKSFIYDNCANRKGKGTLFALKRFDKFKRKVTSNLSKQAFCLKADIKHYFQEVDRGILLKIIQRRVDCSGTCNLIQIILSNFEGHKGMPLGNLTSQFFANVYLNELDWFVKYKLRVRYYIRYVDDFVILHKFEWQLINWKIEINQFLRFNLKIELHKDKSSIILISRGVDFVGFRNFYYHRLLRKRNIRKMKVKIDLFNHPEMEQNQFIEVFLGWTAYSNLANSYSLVKSLIKMINLR
ncbi:MAG TPA: reverse transcriptase domain-containing protein [Candidatus Nanoarchaeia archaeon]|nr:reverse transcriptase domain-containing protein [Candidatus Nanoarchaeia archaeon]